MTVYAKPGITITPVSPASEYGAAVVSVSYQIGSIADGSTLASRTFQLQLLSPEDPAWLTRELKRDIAAYMIQQAGGDPLASLARALAGYSDADMRTMFSL